MKIVTILTIILLAVMLAAIVFVATAQAQSFIDLHATFPYAAGPFVTSVWSCAVADQENMFCSRPSIGTVYQARIVDEGIQLPTMMECTVLDLRFESPDNWRVYARCETRYPAFLPYLSR
jgi:hypothetical protein